MSVFGSALGQLDGRDSDRFLEMAQIAVSNSMDGIIIHTAEGQLLYFNAAAARNSGFTMEEFAALPDWGFAGTDSFGSHEQRIAALARVGSDVFISERALPSGERLVLEVHASHILTESGPVIVAVSRDVTERVRAQEALKRLAFHDALTGLANRALFDDRLDIAIAGARRRENILGLVFVDVDDFKLTNDSFGHDVGDRVLVALGERLLHAVRDEDTVARLGGDEFVVILPRLAQVRDLDHIADKLARSLSAVLRLGDRELSVSASIGTALFNPAEDDARSLMMRADIAMYEAKRTRAGDGVLGQAAATWIGRTADDDFAALP